jgi:MscS family membrane protein
LRTLDGDLVTIPNGELANKFIRNVGRRPHLRRVVELGVAYDTSPDRLQRAVEILRELLANHEGAHADFPSRVYFKDFGESALKIEAVYWYHPADYWAYMAFNDRLNREILRRFNDEGIRFAFPTRTVHLAGNGLTTPAHA